MVHVKPNRLGTREGPAAPIVGGPFDGDEGGLVPGADVLEMDGHLYRLDREDTGAPFWHYVGFAVVGKLS